MIWKLYKFKLALRAVCGVSRSMFQIDGLVQERYNSMHWSYIFLAITHRYVNIDFEFRSFLWMLIRAYNFGVKAPNCECLRWSWAILIFQCSKESLWMQWALFNVDNILVYRWWYNHTGDVLYRPIYGRFVFTSCQTINSLLTGCEVMASADGMRQVKKCPYRELRDYAYFFMDILYGISWSLLRKWGYMTEKLYVWLLWYFEHGWNILRTFYLFSMNIWIFPRLHEQQKTGRSVPEAAGHRPD